MKRLFKKIKLAIFYWLARRLPDCKTITPKISESLDRRLSLREKIIMKLHLWTCGKCTRYFEQIRFLSETMHKHEERLTENESPAICISVEAKERIRTALKSTTGLAI